jgi:hypothetical protein
VVARGNKAGNTIMDELFFFFPLFDAVPHTSRPSRLFPALSTLVNDAIKISDVFPAEGPDLRDRSLARAELKLGEINK